MEWLILLGMFLISAFVTYGFFANIEEARRERARAASPEAPQAGTAGGALSEKLARELELAGKSGSTAEHWLAMTRVPYGHCVSTDPCDHTTRCVQCSFFSTTQSDLPALRKLYEQEVELARASRERDLVREAEIHDGIAACVLDHLDEFESASQAG